MCLKELTLRAQNMVIILGSIVNIIGRGVLNDHLASMNFLPFDDAYDVHQQRESLAHSLR